MKTWYHYVMTYDGKDAHIYVDGEKVDGSSENIKLPTAPGPLYVGVGGVGPGTWAMESGIVDEVFVFSRQLDKNEIKSIMDKGVVQAVDPKDKLTTTWSIIKTSY